MLGGVFVFERGEEGAKRTAVALVAQKQGLQAVLPCRTRIGEGVKYEMEHKHSQQHIMH